MSTTWTNESGRVPSWDEFLEFYTKSQIEWEARHEKLERDIAKITKNVGGLGNSLGEMIETLIAARLWEKFSDYPYDLKRAYHQVPIFDGNNQIITDIDILLSNTEWVMAVEVKQKLKRK